MTTISYTASRASALSHDIATIDSVSQFDGGDDIQYSITLPAGASLTEDADIAAINLAGNDSLTISGNGATLDGASRDGALGYQGLFVYSDTVIIENLTIANTDASGALGGLFVANNSGGGSRRSRRTSHSTMFPSPTMTP
jgi:hypothetical protein